MKHTYIVQCTLVEKIEATDEEAAIKKFLGQTVDKLGDHPGVTALMIRNIETNLQPLPAHFPR